ncbi:protein FAM243A [Terrapene carolina triunguis]|uniref:Family with sequence similarity 243 member A n=1 Tax=Terrapene triunguis TaxID=2587831 RepID=A0A674KF46_9SAUR|nr:protein FAM243A [Terrapene carolina triunguis]
MYSFVNPLLKHIIHRSSFDTAARKQCLKYLKALRTLQFNGLNTIFLGETDISESLVTGEKILQEDSLNWPTWTLVHAASSQGWVPWRYRVLLRDELPMKQDEDIFQEFCDSLNKFYGKCIIVVREKRQPSVLQTKEPTAQEKITHPQVPSVIYMSSIECCPQIAKANGHELLSVPLPYNYLHPMDVAWSSLKWFIINNRKEFCLRSIERTYSYRCILFSDLVEKGLEKMTPSKWKMATNKVRRWENYYLDTFA